MLEMIENSKPIPCGDDQTELHVLTGRRDLEMCLWAVKSFLAHSGRRMPIIVHSDGTLLDAESARLERHLPGCEIIDRIRARREVPEFLEPYPSLRYFRGTLEHVMFYKLIDFFFYSRTRRVLAIDSDMLWLKQPVQMNQLLDTGTGFFMNDIANAYGFNVDALRRYYGIRLGPRMNAGVVHVPGADAYNLDLLEYAATLSLKHQKDRLLGRGRWHVQTFFAVLFSVEHERFQRLDSQEYVIPAEDATGDEDITLVHCVTPRRALFPLYAQKAMEHGPFAALFADSDVPSTAESAPPVALG